jgi:hypothetical protein
MDRSMSMALVVGQLQVGATSDRDDEWDAPSIWGPWETTGPGSCSCKGTQWRGRSLRTHRASLPTVACAEDATYAVRRDELALGECCRRYWWTAVTTTEPSPTADATLFTEPARTSPTANTPGTLVSKPNGSRGGSGSPPAGTRSRPVSTKPASSTIALEASHFVLGSVPINTNSAVASCSCRSRSPLWSHTASRCAEPVASTTCARSSTSTLSSSQSCWMR